MSERCSIAALRSRRLRSFRLHLIGYAGVMAVLIAANVFFSPSEPWFVLPLVAWGAPLAIHAAWAMDLFGSHGS